jgi:hypothetical protein
MGVRWPPDQLSPSHNLSILFVAASWDEDVVFKNQTRGEVKAQRRFINDTVRSDFHRKFLERYIK